MPTVDDWSVLTAPRLKEAYLYWVGKLAGRAMPRRRDIDPTEIPALLPYVALIDVLPDADDFRYRLIGSEVRDLASDDHTGRRFSDIAANIPGSTFWDDCRETVRTRLPQWRSPLYIGAKRWLKNCENLLLPYSEDGSQVSLILEVISFELARR
jgi:hypothetical protein